jgi:deazaflavin-dependent oxidoreductase (nitroreductase family)
VRAIVLIVVIAFAFVWMVAVPLFERFASVEAVRTYQRLTMPLWRPLAGWIPGFGVVETTGRRTGRTYRIPVGGRVSGSAFWFVAGIGRRNNSVRNMEANPRVRVKANGRWRTGTAHVLPDDDAKRRRFWASPMNGVFLAIAGGEHLTVRIDLD